MKTNMKRMLGLLMAVLMVLQLLPMTTLAEARLEDQIIALTVLQTEDDPVDNADTTNETEHKTTSALDSDNFDVSVDETDVLNSTVDPAEDSPAPVLTDDTVTEPDGETEDTGDDSDGLIIYDDPDIIGEWEPSSLEEEIDVLYGGSWIRYGIYQSDHTYVLTKGATQVYDDPSLGSDHLIYTISDECTPLLATDHYQRGNTIGVTVWFITPTGDLQFGYVRESDLVNASCTDEEAEAWTASKAYTRVDFGEYEHIVFAAEGAFPEAEEEESGAATLDSGLDEADQPVDALSESETDTVVLPAEEPAVEDESEDDSEEASDSQDPLNEMEMTGQEDELFLFTDDLFTDDLSTDDLSTEDLVSVGDYVLVTTGTHVYPEADLTVDEGFDGVLCMGCFTRDAVAQITAIFADELDHEWYEVRYHKTSCFSIIL